MALFRSDIPLPSRYFYRSAETFYHAGGLRTHMANQLNIKSEDGYRLATELSLLTGESLTAAVTEALRERLEREQRARDRTAKLARLTALAAEIRASLRLPPGAGHDFLYDASGRPR
jgi:antitoxin VapB